jgi:hypothetical protein
MFNRTRRSLTITLAATALTVLGAGGASAARPAEGGGAPNPTHPVCENGTNLSVSPLCKQG